MSFTELARQERGFTMVELVTVMIILGILAVVMLPRLDGGAFRSLEFRDKVVAALRYAQKSASSHRRMVCVAFTATSLTMTMDTAKSAVTCATPLNVPGGTSNSLTSTDAANAAFSAAPAALYFQPDGRVTSTAGGTSVANPTLDFVGGAESVTIVGRTGYVQ